MNSILISGVKYYYANQSPFPVRHGVAFFTFNNTVPVITNYNDVHAKIVEHFGTYITQNDWQLCKSGISYRSCIVMFNTDYAFTIAKMMLQTN